MFDDVEVLKQQSPTKENKQRRRSASPEKTITRRASKRSFENAGEDQDEDAGRGGVGR